MKNLFKEVLVKLIDDTKVMSRAKWSQYLLVSEAAISQWLNGKTIPKSEHLRNIISYLENFETQEIQNALYDFYDVADMPVTISLNEDVQDKFRGFPTISDYISSSDLYAFQVELSRVHGTLKKDVLYLCSEFVRSLKDLTKVNSERLDIQILHEALLKIEKNHITDFLGNFIEEKASEPDIVPENLIDTSKVVVDDKTDNTLKHTNKALHNLRSIYRMDDPENGSEYKCEILMLAFNSHNFQEVNIPEIEAEEIVFYKVDGECEWLFDNSETLDFTKNNIGWFKSKQKLDTKSFFPKSRLKIKKNGYGILVLYNESGIRFEDHYKPQKRVTYSHYSHFDYFINALPNRKVEYINLFKNLQNKRFSKKRLSISEEVYLNSIFDKWPGFRDSVISLKLVNIPAWKKGQKEVLLNSHFGYGVIIPIYSSLNVFTCRLPLENNSVDELRVSIDNPEIVKTEIESIHKSGNANLYVLNCEIPHYIMGGEHDTICLYFQIKRHSVTNIVDGNLIIRNPIIDIDNPTKFYEKTILRDNFVE